MKYEITYERKTGKHYWTFASEKIDARGIMHARKIASDHLKELQKYNKNYDMRISRIKELD